MDSETAPKRAPRARVLTGSAYGLESLSAAPPSVHGALRSPGAPLDPGTRAFMERHLQFDFSRVRVHTDQRAAESARELDATAYTFGRHIVFGAGSYAPLTTRGRGLLAHELTHVVQQTQPGLRRSPEGASEAEAQVAGDQAAAGRSSPINMGAPAVIQRQRRTKDELDKRLAEVQHELSTGTGVRSPESIAKLKAEEQDLLAASKRASVDELQRQLDSNRQKQRIGAGVRSPEAIAKLKQEQDELQMRIAIAGGIAVAAPNVGPAARGAPFVNWDGGNLRGIPAEGQIQTASYPGATRLPAGYPGVDLIQGGNRTPLTGYGRGQAGKLPLSEDSIFIEGGTLIQLKTLKNSLPYYQQPDKLFETLSKGMEKLASIKPGAGKSEQAGGAFFRVEHSGTAERKILHIELEAPPTPEQVAQIDRLKEAGKSFKDFGPGEEIEVVVNWPGSGPKPSFKVTSEGVAGGVATVVAVGGMYGREKQRERQAEQEGYAPVGVAAHQEEGIIGAAARAGAFLRGDQAEMFTGTPSLPNIPVWRNSIRQKAAAKKPGETLPFNWQFTDRSQPMPRTQDIIVTYEKHPDGSWGVREVSDKPVRFRVPDLNRIIDPGVSDSSVEDMISGPTA